MRPRWPTCPPALRAAVAARLGAPGGRRPGRRRGLHPRLRRRARRPPTVGRAFVKAAPAAEQPHLVDWYAREAAILDRLPAGLPAPRPRWTLAAAGWFALVPRRRRRAHPACPGCPPSWTPPSPGTPQVAAALADPPAELTALGLPRLADLARADILWWGEVAAGREPTPAAARRRPAAGCAELVALESRLPGYAAAATGLIHGDLRVDNVLIDPDGRAWFCDWTWLCSRAGLVRPGRPAAHRVRQRAGRGRDSSPLTRRPPARPPDALDATLAALAGYYLTGAAAAPPTASPHLPAHQRWSGEQSLDWLARRQGWR